MNDDTELLTAAQAAVRMGVTSTTVRRMIDSGELVPAQKLPGPNGAYLFRRPDVETVAQKRDRAKALARAAS